MLIKFETPNGSMSIVAERFFPATKKDIRKLKKAMADPYNDLKRVVDAIDNMIRQIEVYANDCKARMEIHEMSLKEELEESFMYKAEARKIAFYESEYKRAKEEMRELNQNKEDLHG